MGYSIKFLNCNSNCNNCYEARIRKINPEKEYDIDAIMGTLKASIEKWEDEYKQLKEKQPDLKKQFNQLYRNPTIHGGEPLMMRIEDIERIFKFIYEKFGSTGIQTNGMLISKEHIELFQKYNTHVGVSLDGHTKKLNVGRGYDPRIVLNNMAILKKKNIKMSTITVLRNCNLNDDLLLFLAILKNEFGIVDDVRLIPETNYDTPQVDNEKLGKYLCKIADVCVDDPSLIYQPIREIIDLLLGNGLSTCTLNECDPYHTLAEVPIFYDGSLGNCLRSGGAVDGIKTLRTDKQTLERYEILKQIPQKYNGCKDCKYWNICYGGCPGTGIDNDWRNRTRFCDAYRIVFSYIENKLRGLFPNIHLSVDFYKRDSIRYTVNSIAGSSYRKDKRKNIDEIQKQMKEEMNKKDGHQDWHGDSPHQDSNDPEWRKANPNWQKKNATNKRLKRQELSQNRMGV